MMKPINYLLFTGEKNVFAFPAMEHWRPKQLSDGKCVEAFSEVSVTVKQKIISMSSYPKFVLRLFLKNVKKTNCI